MLVRISLILGAVLLFTRLAAATLQIDLSRETGRFNPLILGQNLEAADTRGIFGPPVGAAKWPLQGVKYGQGLWNPTAQQPADGSFGLAESLNSGMLRYPGGCLVHNFNWKDAVGPLSERPQWKFGVDQFLELCRRLNQEPVITLTDYALPAAELPAHFAEFVEYLNAPATPEHPWAQKRALWGHPEPYGVRYFELGNESGHGNHNGVPRRKFTPEEYADYAVKSAAAIRRADPSVKLGIVMAPGSGINWDCEWNRKVLAGAGAVADYVVLHFYGPAILNSGPEEALRAVLAYPDQLAARIGCYRRNIRELAGRDLPTAVTEYNVGSSKSKPFPHRFSFMAGLMCADEIRLWQQENMLFANYWHLLNGAWGLFRTPDESGEVTRRYATLPFFEEWGKFGGRQLVEAVVADNPRLAAAPLGGLWESRGDRPQPERRFASRDTFRFDFGKYLPKYRIKPAAAGKNALTFQLDEVNRESYLPFAVLPRPQESPFGTGYKTKLRFEARFTPEGKGRGTVALGLADTRGWNVTNSASASDPIAADGKFHEYWFELPALPACPSTELLLRVERPSGLSGKLEIRNLVAEEFHSPTEPAYPALAALAGKSADGRTLHLIVFNKDPERPMTVPVAVTGGRLKSGTGFELYQEKPESIDYFTPARRAVPVRPDGFDWTFPPHSMTRFELELLP
ncbi:hypothetical protein [Victivallis vadensis]|uniref:hypothetical protein n=1 Tax=Victivallis vadensis TaxID=172901 RepID=UPI0026DDC940|nr:hypothetical protein [Victivallis vadensis]